MVESINCKYLIDTNIWLELLLAQEREQEVRNFLSQIETHLLAISEFSLYSIGLILARFKQEDIFLAFLVDLFDKGNVKKICLEISELKRLCEITNGFRLDFDDAYQYVVAEKYDLIIVSFDKHFDSTPRKKKEPQELLIRKNN